MTDQNTPLSVPPQPPRAARWMRVTLALSLALNLAVVGVVAGAALKGYRDGDRPSAMRDLGVGALAEALTREDRRALAQAIRSETPDRSAMRRAWSQDFAALLGALRAEPFQTEAMQVALDGMTTTVGAQRAVGQRIVVRHIAAMSPQARAAFADRLEEGRKKRSRREPER